MRSIVMILAGAGWAFGTLAAPVGNGLQLSSGEWPLWQARMAAVSQPTGWSVGLGPERFVLGAASLAGDRYLGLGRVGDGGGLRATGALLFGPPSQALAAPAPAGPGDWLVRPSLQSTPRLGDATDLGATPYLGMGYTAWWAHSGLSLSADLGLLAQRPARLARGTLAPDGADGLDRLLQLTPVLQVQLSYAF